MEDDVWVPTLDESHLQEETINLVSPKGVSIILIKKDARIFAAVPAGTTSARPTASHPASSPSRQNA